MIFFIDAKCNHLLFFNVGEFSTYLGAGLKTRVIRHSVSPLRNALKNWMKHKLEEQPPIKLGD